MGEGEVETNHTNGCEANGGPDSGDDRKKSAADLIIAPIQVIIPPGYTDDESEDEVEREQREKRKKKKKKTKKTVDKTMILTRTFAEAIRLINETKVRLQALISLWLFRVFMLLIKNLRL